MGGLNLDIGVYGMLSTLIATIGTYLVTKRKNKQEEKQSDFSTITQVIQIWQDLAQSHKAHWDACEEKNEQLAKQVESLQEIVLTMKSEIAVMKIQIDGKVNT